MSLKLKCVPCFYLTLILHVSISCFGQDSAWKNTPITSDVSIYLPGPIYTIDTTQLKAYNCRLHGYVLQVKYLKPKFEARSGDELMQGYDGFLKGYFNSKEIKPYTNTAHDTSISGTTGEWVHSIYSKDTVFSEMFTYVVLVNSHFYMATFAARRPIDPTVYPIISRFCGSLNFPHQPIKEYSGDFPLQAKSYRLGQHIGRLTPVFLIIGLAVLVVILIYTKIIRKRKKQKIH
jgi:hypothetical protein